MIDWIISILAPAVLLLAIGQTGGVKLGHKSENVKTATHGVLGKTMGCYR